MHPGSVSRDEGRGMDVLLRDTPYPSRGKSIQKNLVAYRGLYGIFVISHLTNEFLATCVLSIAFVVSAAR